MKVLLYTIEMVRGIERLMPWKSLLEVARWMDLDGMECAICSAQKEDAVREYEGVTIYSIEYGIEALRQFVQDGRWDVVYYPITYRQGLKSMNNLEYLGTRMIAYIPGGICSLSGCLKLVQMGHVKRALPYLLDTITPHSFIATKLQSIGFEGIVCQAPFTGDDAKRSGWKNVQIAVPGLDVDKMPYPDDSKVKSLGMKGTKFLLFSGAPAPTRGAIMTMKSFDQIANKIPNTKLLMLMRKDVSSDFKEFNKAVSEIKNKDRIIVDYDCLTYAQVLGAFREAWAVLLPFVIVPSEIPLTFFEVMHCGTPVITFENGGTTDYLRNGIKIAKSRSKKALCRAMLDICTNDNERNALAKESKALMNNHPTWEQTAKEWVKAILFNAL